MEQGKDPQPLSDIALPGVTLWRKGKVRELYDLEDRLLIVASDRISAFDVILSTAIPGKGAVLTQLSAFWFGLLEDVVPNHLITTDVAEYPAQLQPFRGALAGRSMIVRKTEPLPVECVVRGYLAGSGWKDYTNTGSVCGISLAPGLRQAERFKTPLFTPATKASEGHDENVSFAAMARLVGEELAARLRDVSLTIYSRARQHAERQGLILADTKFEFGLQDGRLIWIDEALTPDSSRFWPEDGYAPGRAQPSFDKQYVRDYLETLDWDKRPPAPPLPRDVANRTAEKYREAYRRLTGCELA